MSCGGREGGREGERGIEEFMTEGREEKEGGKCVSTCSNQDFVEE